MSFASVSDWTNGVQVPKDATRQELDAYIIMIRRQSNTLVPIARLPPEILSRIFYECVQLPGSSLEESLWTLWWIKATHVCHHWRSVFLSTPTLWDEVTFSGRVSGEPVQEWLARSQDTPLKILVNQVHYPFPPEQIQQLIFDPILDVWPRVRHLQLCLPRHIVRQFVWPRSTTSLEHLSILDSHLFSVPALEDGPFEEFLQTLNERFPRLKELIAFHYTFDFKTWSLPTSLNTLNVTNRLSPRAGTVTIAETVQALRQLTSLNHLSLVHVLPEGSPADWPTMEPLAFPLLQTLKLEGFAHAHVWLLHVLEFPSTIQLDLLLVIDHSYPMLPSLSATLESVGPFLSAAIGIAKGWDESEENFTFKAWHLVQGVQHKEEVADFKISFILEEDRPTNDWAGLQPLLETFPLSSIQTLFINCDEGAFFFAPRVYGKMKQVHTLSLVGDREFRTSILFMVDLLHDSKYEGDTIFPSLRIFHASEVDLSMVTDRFQTVLRRYRDRYKPLKIVLRLCYNLTAKAVDDLKQLAEVEWDGMELAATDSSDEYQDEDDDEEEDIWQDEDDPGYGSDGYDYYGYDLF